MGFGSKVSTCDGPPFMNKKITRFARGRKCGCFAANGLTSARAPSAIRAEAASQRKASQRKDNPHRASLAKASNPAKHSQRQGSLRPLRGRRPARLRARARAASHRVPLASPRARRPAPVNQPAPRRRHFPPQPKLWSHWAKAWSSRPEPWRNSQNPCSRARSSRRTPPRRASTRSSRECSPPRRMLSRPRRI